MVTFDEWFQSKQGEAYETMYCFARDAWKAAQEVEREACADICAKVGTIGSGISEEAIRARGNN